MMYPSKIKKVRQEPHLSLFILLCLLVSMATPPLEARPLNLRQFEKGLKDHEGFNLLNLNRKLGVQDSGFKLPDLNLNVGNLKSIFNESSYFPVGSQVLQIGLGLGSTVNLKQLSGELNQIDARLRIPPISVMYERQIWKENVGIGLLGGYQMWTVPILRYQYRYYTIGLRGSYHLNIEALPQLDPYVALGFSTRFIQLTNGDRGETEGQLTSHLIIGARYYLKNKVAVFMEIGQDATSTIKFGISYTI